MIVAKSTRRDKADAPEHQRRVYSREGDERSFLLVFVLLDEIAALQPTPVRRNPFDAGRRR